MKSSSYSSKSLTTFQSWMFSCLLDLCSSDGASIAFILSKFSTILLKFFRISECHHCLVCNFDGMILCPYNYLVEDFYYGYSLFHRIDFLLFVEKPDYYFFLSYVLYLFGRISRSFCIQQILVCVPPYKLGNM